VRCGARWLRALAVVGLCVAAATAAADELPEFRLKTAFIYNFMLFTQFPVELGSTLNLCVYGNDPFGKEIDALQGKTVDSRRIAVQYRAGLESLKTCQVVFIPPASIGDLAHVLDSLRGLPVLTVADSPGAMRRGVVLNMNVVRDKVTFEANSQAARSAGLFLSSKLLHLATEVQQ
jgi:hypothetical protein